jgi:hypothetical protein
MHQLRFDIGLFVSFQMFYSTEKPVINMMAGFFMCARQGALTKECSKGKQNGKSPTTPAGGIVSRTARVSIARWNLKEAEDKALI